MPMELKGALERMDAMLATLRDHAGTGEMRECCHQAAANAEALGVVLTAARENHASRLVAEVNATTAKVLELERAEERAALSDPKRHDWLSDPWHENCSICRQREAHVP